MIPWTVCKDLRPATHSAMQQSMFPPSDGNFLGWAFLETVPVTGLLTWENQQCPKYQSCLKKGKWKTFPDHALKQMYTTTHFPDHALKRIYTTTHFPWSCPQADVHHHPLSLIMPWSRCTPPSTFLDHALKQMYTTTHFPWSCPKADVHHHPLLASAPEGG